MKLIIYILPIFLIGFFSSISLGNEPPQGMEGIRLENGNSIPNGWYTASPPKEKIEKVDIVISQKGKKIQLSRKKLSDESEIAMFVGQGRGRMTIDLRLEKFDPKNEIWLILDGIAFQFDSETHILGGRKYITQVIESQRGQDLDPLLQLFKKAVAATVSQVNENKEINQ